MYNPTLPSIIKWNGIPYFAVGLLTNPHYITCLSAVIIRYELFSICSCPHAVLFVPTSPGCYCFLFFFLRIAYQMEVLLYLVHSLCWAVHYVIHVIFNDTTSETGRVRIWCGLNVGPSVMNTLFGSLSPRLGIFFLIRPSSRELSENRVCLLVTDKTR